MNKLKPQIKNQAMKLPTERVSEKLNKLSVKLHVVAYQASNVNIIKFTSKNI